MFFLDRNAFVTVFPAVLRFSTTADSCSKGLKPLLCTTREAQDFSCKKKKEKKSKHRMYDRERPPGSVAPQYPSVYLTRHNSTSLSENFPSKEGFDCWGNHFLSRQREHPKEKACAVREFAQGEFGKSTVIKVRLRVSRQCAGVLLCQLEFAHGNEGFPCGALRSPQRYEAFSSVRGIRAIGLGRRFLFFFF